MSQPNQDFGQLMSNDCCLSDEKWMKEHFKSTLHIGGQVLKRDEKLDETLREWPGDEMDCTPKLQNTPPRRQRLTTRLILLVWNIG